MDTLLSKLDGYKTVLGIFAFIAWSWAVQHGAIADDDTVRAAIYGWIIYGAASKLDKAKVKP